jgi:hypothetical protein
MQQPTDAKSQQMLTFVRHTVTESTLFSLSINATHINRTKEVAMKIPIRRPRSCLGWFLWPLSILLSLVLLYNIYAWVQIFAVQSAAYELAGELGYKPEDYLRSGLYSANVDIITGEATCYAVFYFATPLELDAFEVRLLRAHPGTSRFMDGIERSKDIYWDLPLTVDGTKADIQRALEKLPDVPTVSWDLPGGRSMDASMVRLYLTQQVPAKLAFAERQIHDNIAVVTLTGGRRPFWAFC